MDECTTSCALEASRITHRQVPSHAEAGDGCWEEGRPVVARGWSPQEDPGLQVHACVCT